MPLPFVLKEKLRLLTAGRVRFDEPMRFHTTFHIGGPAEIWAEPSVPEELRQLLRVAGEEGLEITVIGGGANLLVGDGGIPGLVLHLGGPAFQGFRRGGEGAVAGAGLPLERLIQRSREQGLSGAEFLAGVPGRVGGSVRMNAGTHDEEGRTHSFSDILHSVTVMDRDGEIRILSRDQMRFAYRSSELGSRIVLEAALSLIPDDPAAVAQRIQRLWAFKKRTQDWTAPSAGCIFKNPIRQKTPGEEVHSAGWLIDRAGLKGRRIGGAAVSRVHANFILNQGTAQAADVLKLIEEIQEQVRDKFAVDLELEVQVLPKPVQALAGAIP